MTLFCLFTVVESSFLNRRSIVKGREATRPSFAPRPDSTARIPEAGEHDSYPNQIRLVAQALSDYAISRATANIGAAKQNMEFMVEVDRVEGAAEPRVKFSWSRFRDMVKRGLGIGSADRRVVPRNVSRSSIDESTSLDEIPLSPLLFDHPSLSPLSSESARSSPFIEQSNFAPSVRYLWLDAVTLQWPTNAPHSIAAVDTETEAVLCVSSEGSCDLTGLSPGQRLKVKFVFAESVSDFPEGSTNESAEVPQINLEISSMDIDIPQIQQNYTGACGRYSDGRWFVPSSGYDPKTFVKAVESVSFSNVGKAGATAANIVDWSLKEAASINDSLGLGFSGISSGCADCFGGAAYCGFTKCFSKCAGNPMSKRCRQCHSDKCSEEFHVCVAINDEFVVNQLPPAQ